MPQMPGSRASGARVLITLLVVGVAAYIIGRPLYWRFAGDVTASSRPPLSDCLPCVCDCPQNNLLLPSGQTNLSTDCVKVDPTLQKEMEKHSVDLLSEELKLQGIVAEESQQRADSAFSEVKNMSSQYQKETEKCNLGMETCEEAREIAEAALIEQIRVGRIWEQRARNLGWKD
ncbi:hypothetical protein KP509_13G017800 [Ceratopteris richardii]|uniref:Uncharacterized protein n=1 Tax=Ceratopteris richardii TaxID=49495 RepID=A0A8T2TDS6_CERRI|nr:hypothetical protein KP509_13G017800 [Ceratopteris richardii]